MLWKGSHLIARARALLARRFIQDTLILQAGKIGSVILSLISSLLVWRLMGAHDFGIYGWAQTFLGLWLALDLTGIGPSTGTRLAMAIGARDDREILNLMAFYMQVTLTFTLGLVTLILLLSPMITDAWYGDRHIGELAGLLSLGLIADDFYMLVTTSLQARRSMKTLALMQNANQFVLTTCLIAAVLISPTPEALVIGRLVYSYSTLLMALIVYHRTRTRGDLPFPPLVTVMKRTRTLSPRPYWKFGVANALDKNVTALFSQIPMQIVGVVGGASAVGYLTLASAGIAQASVLSSAVFDNMQAVVPQMVGRGDYVGLRRNFLRVLIALIVLAVVFYGVVAVTAPIFIPPLLGAEWIPAIAPLLVLCVYGVITGFGGVFGSLYRSFNLVWKIVAAKVVTLAIMLPLGAVLLLTGTQTALRPYGEIAAQVIPAQYLVSDAAATGGALTIVGIYALSVTLTAIITLPVLEKKAHENA